MRADVDELLITLFQGICPRVGFGAELLAAIMDDSGVLTDISSAEVHRRRGWLMAGAVAGVISATGVVYVAARRHHGGAA